jgi:hypothetical protein
MTKAVLRTNGLYLSFGAILVAAYVLVAESRKPARLDRQTLSASRGAGLGSSFQDLPCSGFSGFYGCEGVGGNCSACDVDHFYSIVPGGTGYKKHKTSTYNCGYVYNGSCIGMSNCFTSGNPVGICDRPEYIVIQ